MTKQTKIKHYTKRDYAAFAYLAPWIIGMLILQLYPFLSSLVYSFCNYKITGTPSFTGLSNYIQLFTMDNEFWNSLKVTLAYTLYTVPGKLVMALAVAVFLNRDIKGINLIRTLYYIPSLFGGSVAVALLWKIMFMDNGVINAIDHPAPAQRTVAGRPQSSPAHHLHDGDPGSLVLPWSCSWPR